MTESESKLKDVILNEIVSVLGSKVSHLSLDELREKVFYSSNSLRLTLIGFVYVKAIFTAYSFSIPVDKMKSKHSRALSTLKYPYFVTQKRLVLFSESDATMVKLYGDVGKFLENCIEVKENE